MEVLVVWLLVVEVVGEVGSVNEFSDVEDEQLTEPGYVVVDVVVVVMIGLDCDTDPVSTSPNLLGSSLPAPPIGLQLGFNRELDGGEYSPNAIGRCR